MLRSFNRMPFVIYNGTAAEQHLDWCQPRSICFRAAALEFELLGEEHLTCPCGEGRNVVLTRNDDARHRLFRLGGALDGSPRMSHISARFAL
jgi:hypothetical protein